MKYKYNFDDIIFEEKIKTWINNIAPLRPGYKYIIIHGLAAPSYRKSFGWMINIITAKDSNCKLEDAMENAYDIDPWANLRKIDIVLNYFLDCFGSAYFIKEKVFDNIMKNEDVPEKAYERYVNFILDLSVNWKFKDINLVNSDGLFIHRKNIKQAEKDLAIYKLKKVKTNADYTQFIYNDDYAKLYTLLKLQNIC